MIIKSLSRRTASFAQLLAYLDRPGLGRETVLAHNLFAAANDPEAVVAEFMENAGYLKTRKRGVALFHEVISLEQGAGLSTKRQSEILRDIGHRWLSLRGPEQLGYARIHHDTNHPHVHIVLSSNRPRSHRRVRLSKAEFRNLQVELEHHVRQSFPELGERPLYETGRERTDRIRIGNREYEMARREGRVPVKALLHEMLGAELENARSYDELQEQTESIGYRLYQRGRSWGVEDLKTGRHHRLKTLGLDKNFSAAKERFALLGERRESIELERGNERQEASRENDGGWERE